MGAINNLNMFKVTNLSNEIDLLKKNGFWIYSSALSENSEDYNKVKYDKKLVLVVGSENKGVSKIILDKSDFIINIPMCGNVQSLNVSVATGILLSKIVSSTK
jgi:23S rRNA (guanosine2251-2'-O)-methyltransferase